MVKIPVLKEKGLALAKKKHAEKAPLIFHIITKGGQSGLYMLTTCIICRTEIEIILIASTQKSNETMPLIHT